MSDLDNKNVAEFVLKKLNSNKKMNNRELTIQVLTLAILMSETSPKKRLSAKEIGEKTLELAAKLGMVKDTAELSADEISIKGAEAVNEIRKLSTSWSKSIDALNKCIINFKGKVDSLTNKDLNIDFKNYADCLLKVWVKMQVDIRIEKLSEDIEQKRSDNKSLHVKTICDEADNIYRILVSWDTYYINLNNICSLISYYLEHTDEKVYAEIKKVYNSFYELLMKMPESWKRLGDHPQINTVTHDLHEIALGTRTGKSNVRLVESHIHTLADYLEKDKELSTLLHGHIHKYKRIKCASNPDEYLWYDYEEKEENQKNQNKLNEKKAKNKEIELQELKNRIILYDKNPEERNIFYSFDPILGDDEIEFLKTAVLANQYISKEKAEHLINELTNLQTADYLPENYRVESSDLRVKHSEENKLVKYVSILKTAAEKKKKVKMQYGSYRLSDKNEIKLCPEKEEALFSVFGVVFTGHYYTIAHTPNRGERYLNYRIDRILSLELTDEDSEEMPEELKDYFDEPKNSFKGIAFRKGHPSFFGGEVETFTLYVEEWMLNQLVDTFGDKVVSTGEKYGIVSITRFNGSLRVRVRASKEGIKIFCTQYAGVCWLSGKSVLEKEIRKKIEETLEKALNRYRDMDEKVQ